jgi:hypothetical protein
VAKVKSEAYDLKASQLKGTHGDVSSYEDLAIWLSQELDIGLAARSGVDLEIRENWKRYEQQRTRQTPPWPGAADLTSPITTEYTDAMHARVMETIFADNVWTVEGWGEAAGRAPFVEEFHQRTLEEERLQDYLDEVMLRAWHEPAGILEVSESGELRLERVQQRVAMQLDPLSGMPVMGEDTQPALQTNPETGEYLEVTDPNVPSVLAEVDVWRPVRVGPAYDVVPYLDFLTLPAHARNKDQIWGYAKRFHRRVPELKAKAKKGIYDKQAVEAMGEENERETTAFDGPSNGSIPEQRGPTAQKELWEVQFLADLDGKGERWYRATVHKDKHLLLRLKFDDRVTRYIRFVPYKKPGSIDGYTLSGHKLITVHEEDTAVRNMRADMAAMAIASPVLKRQGALWDEYEQPFGPRAVITVRDKDEITQLQLRDVPQSINVWKSDVRMDGDRLVGQNDTSLGVDSGENNTLGEERLRAGYAEVRVNLLIKRLKEPMEELWQARHAIWKRTLADQQSGALPVLQKTLVGMEARGIDTTGINDGQITPDMLDGAFWGKPRGSVESADLQGSRNNFNNFMAAISMMAQVNPMVAMLTQTGPFAKAMLEEGMRVHRWPAKQALLGPEAQALMQGQVEQQQAMQDPVMQMLMGLANGGAGSGAPMGAGAVAPPAAPGSPPMPQPQGVM